ncbi:pili assembly chaperone (plasmid) [Pectobacterium versatile]|nr:pili assembly chaperone [Pectobacterium versatile]
MKKRAIPILLSPFLAGCVSLTNNPAQPDTPALVFVDGQISESTDIIAQTQRRLAPPRSTQVPVNKTLPASVPTRTAPLPIPTLQSATTSSPKMASTASGSSPLVDSGARTNQVQQPKGNMPSSLPGLTFTGSPAPVTVLSLTPTRNLTLEQWIRRIMPSGWQLEYENALRPKLNTRIVSLYTNDQWTRVLSRLLTEQSIAGQVDWDRQMVTLRRPGEMTSTHAPSQAIPAVPVTTSATTSPAKNPFSSGASVPTPVTTQDKKATSTAVSVPSVPVVPNKAQFSTGQPVTTMPIGKTWQAPSGATLREVMIKWAGETRCESGASPTWTVIWPMSVTDYRLDAPLTFQGAYESMLGQVFELYRTAKTPLYGQASRLQCVVSVSDTPPVSQ